MAKKSFVKSKKSLQNKKLNYRLILLLSVVFLVIVFVFGKQVLIKTSKNNVSFDTSTLIVFPTPTPIPNKYENNFLGLKFIYPEGWRVETSYYTTPTSHLIEIVNPGAPKYGYIPRITITITKNKLVILSPLTGGYPYSVNGIQSTRWSNPNGLQYANEIVQFKKNEIYYDITLAYDDNENSQNKYDKSALQEFDKLLSTFYTTK